MCLFLVRNPVLALNNGQILEPTQSTRMPISSGRYHSNFLPKHVPRTCVVPGVTWYIPGTDENSPCISETSWHQPCDKGSWWRKPVEVREKGFREVPMDLNRKLVPNWFPIPHSPNWFPFVKKNIFLDELNWLPFLSRNVTTKLNLTKIYKISVLIRLWAVVNFVLW